MSIAEVNSKTADRLVAATAGEHEELVRSVCEAATAAYESAITPEMFRHAAAVARKCSSSPSTADTLTLCADLLEKMQASN